MNMPFCCCQITLNALCAQQTHEEETVKIMPTTNSAKISGVEEEEEKP